MGWFQWPVIIASLILQVLLISVLIRGVVRKYPIVFVYVLVLFFTSIADVALMLDFGRVTNNYAVEYYQHEAMRQMLLFSVVLSFLYKAVKNRRSGRLIRIILVPGGILIATILFYIHRDPNFTLSMTMLNRDTNFISALLNFLLWSILISAKQRDSQLLILTGALGIEFTGSALGNCLRQVSVSTTRFGDVAFVSGNMILLLTDLAFLFFWWRALRSEEMRRTAEVKGAQQEY